MVISEWTLYYLILSLHCMTLHLVFLSVCVKVSKGINIYYFTDFITANDSDKDGTMEMIQGPNKVILLLFKGVMMQKLVIFPSILLQETGKETVANVNRFNDLIFKAVKSVLHLRDQTIIKEQF